MSLSMQTPIQRRDIYHMKELKRGKVFHLQGAAKTDQLVIKADMGTTRMRHKMVNRSVKAIDRGARTKVLSDGELAALRSFASDVTTKLQYLVAADMVAAARELLQTMDYLRGRSDVIVKMKAQKIIDLESALAVAKSGETGNIYILKKALSQRRGLEQLGEIVASDLIAQNADRFDPTARPMTTPKSRFGFTARLTAITNVGNLMAIADGKSYRFSALDSADPGPNARGHEDINRPLAECEKANKWFGRVLANRAQRREFAGKIVDDLEGLLSITSTRYRGRTVLGVRRLAVARLDRGMVRGVKKVLKYWDGKGYLSAKRTPGITDRHRILATVR